MMFHQYIHQGRKLDLGAKHDIEKFGRARHVKLMKHKKPCMLASLGLKRGKKETENYLQSRLLGFVAGSITAKFADSNCMIKAVLEGRNSKTPTGENSAA